MKRILLAFVLVAVSGCSRDSNFLEKVIEPTRPQSPKVTPEPTVAPTPTPKPTPVPKKYSKTLEFKLANTTVTIPAVDIIWVIDNSGSMGDEQQDVIDNTSRFMSTFTANTQLKWKMGLLSTDEAQDQFVGFTPETALDSTTPNPVPIFQNAVARLGTGGSNIEHMFIPVLNNLRKYPDFLTPNAYLAIIVVTDEDEGGERPGGVTASSFVTQLTALKGGDKSKIVSYGVFETTLDCLSGFNYTFSRYWDFMRRVTSTKYPLCDPNFGQLLTSIGEDLISRISTIDPVILLDAKPIPSTIRLTYKGNVLRSGFKEEGGVWIYDPVYNVIRITNVSILDSGVRAIQVAFDIDPKSY
ncbi:MAG: vWA domain-containing protein [Bdellovibrionia bacterium]